MFIKAFLSLMLGLWSIYAFTSKLSNETDNHEDNTTLSLTTEKTSYSNYTNDTRIIKRVRRSIHVRMILVAVTLSPYAGYQINKTGWYNYSMRIFRENDKKYPKDNETLYGVKCNYTLYEKYSPVYLLAFPPNGTEQEKITATLVRAKALDDFVRVIGNQSDASTIDKSKFTEGSELFTELQNLVKTNTTKSADLQTSPKTFTSNETETTTSSSKNVVQNQELISKKTGSEPTKLGGRILEEKICYRDGHELLECNKATSKCDCVKEGELKYLKMSYVPRVNPKTQSINSKEKRCMAEDCGGCVVTSKQGFCGLWGDCHDSLISKDFPFNHVNGTCKGSMYNANFFPKSWGIKLKDVLKTAGANKAFGCGFVWVGGALVILIFFGGWL